MLLMLHNSKFLILLLLLIRTGSDKDIKACWLRAIIIVRLGLLFRIRKALIIHLDTLKMENLLDVRLVLIG
jgi:hypothetical protein